MNKNLAPVAIFVYNRLENTKQVIEALQKNDLAPQTEIFIFSDAPKNPENPRNARNVTAVNEVRKYLKTITGFVAVHIVERPVNFYIEKNITEGVTEIINKYGRIIVLEDDGVTAKNFLTFMNGALDFYEHQHRVMHVATFTFIKMPADYNKTFFWSYSENTGGGWATWKDRWEKFKWFSDEAEGLAGLSEEQKNKVELGGALNSLANLRLNPIPWDICWNIAIVKNDGLAVNSPRALVKNNGLFNGTHFTAFNKILGKHPFDIEIDDSGAEIILEEKIEENPEAMALLKDFYGKMGKRTRDRILHYFVRLLVFLRITKLLKKFKA